MGVSSISVAWHRFQAISSYMEMSAPGILGRIQETPATGLNRRRRAGTVAEPTGIETVLVIPLLVMVLTSGNPMLHGCTAQTFAAAGSEKVGLVKQAECTGEAEIPTQAVAVFGPPSGRGRAMMPWCRCLCRVSQGR